MGTLDEIRQDISLQQIGSHISAIEGIRHPTAAPAALLRAEQYISASLRSLGYCIGEHRFDDGGRAFSNVIATRNGSLHPGSRVIVLAHFDTVSTSPGADDNASGVAVLLELARVLASFQFERTVQFIAANLEENAGEDDSGIGTRGSAALARFARESGWEIEGVVVLESVAYAGDAVVQTAPPGLPFDVPERGDFIAVVANEKSERLAQVFSHCIDRERIPLPYLSLVVPGNGEVLPDTRRSDHAPFWDNGFKAIMLTDTTNFRSPHYHQSGDTLETLNLHFAAEVCRATAALICELAVPVT